jgi:hypothetical protein
MGAGALDRAPRLWHSAGWVDDIFQKKKRRPFLRIGGVFFALLALVSLVDAIRAAPLPFGGTAQATTLESILYRVAAAALCGTFAVWLLAPPRPGRRGESDRLLR